MTEIPLSPNEALTLSDGNGTGNGAVRSARTGNGREKILIGAVVFLSILSLALMGILITSHSSVREVPGNAVQTNVSSAAILPPITDRRNIHDVPNISTGAQLLNFSSCGISSSDRVYHGKEAALGQFPWMALLFSSTGEPICGGTLISDQHVLTAAHCIQDVKTIRIGEYNIDSDPDCADSYGEDCTTVQNFTVANSDIIKHPFYSSSKRINDIALIKLPEPVDMTNNDIVPICLPYGKFRYDYNGQSGEKMTISGWGHTEGGVPSKVLMQAPVITKSSRECERVYHKINPKAILDERIICAAGKDDQNHCSGDSGGPLQYSQNIEGITHTVLHGVMAYGEKNCTSNSLPGTYTRVSYYIEWILNNMT